MESIGSHTAKYLRSLPPERLTDEDKQALKDYESNHGHQPTPEQLENRAKYLEKLTKQSEAEEIKISKDTFWRLFNDFYKAQNKSAFKVTKESLQNIMPVVLYFTKDDEFFECPNLSNLHKPSFDKGLLLIGSYGTGKSSVLKACQSVLQQFGKSYAIHNMNDVVSNYEQCQEPQDKTTFWHYMTNGNACFDDVKTEREASNYGKANLFKDIFEKRYLNPNIITHLTCNYSDAHPNDLEKGIDDFGIRYGGRVYDRMSEKFNVVEFKGVSMRE